MSTKLFDLKQQRETELAKADLILKQAEASKRSLTKAEDEAVDGCMLIINTLNPQIKKLETENTLASQFSKNGPGMFLGGGSGLLADDPIQGQPGGDKRFMFPAVGEYLRTRDPQVMASLTEGGDLQFVIPGYEVRQFIAAYPNVDVWARAGANITDLEAGWINSHQPIVIAGDDPDVYAEGTGPTADQSAHVYVAKLENPKKYAFLSLPTEEAFSDIPQLAAMATQEGISRTMFKVGKAVTAALLTSLTSAAATVMTTGDNYEDLLNLIGKIPVVFASSSNKWMMSRRTLANIRNTRTTGDVGIPVFSAQTNQILGYDVLNNDAVPYGQILFGDFYHSVYLRRAGLTFQLMLEAYRSVGKIGLRFVKRADYAFFSDGANATAAEQPVYLLTTDVFGS